MTLQYPVGKVFSANDNVTYHRAYSVGKNELSAMFEEDNEYVFEDKELQTLKFWDIPASGEFDVLDFPSGISLMVLNDPNTNPHGVLSSILLGKGCFASNRKDSHLGLFVFEHKQARRTKRSKRDDPFKHHCYMFPTETMTLDNFIDYFVGDNPTSEWSVCNAVAQADVDTAHEPDDENIDNQFNHFATSPRDTSLIQLMKLLKSSAKKFGGNLRQRCISLYNLVVRISPASLGSMLESEPFAFRLYALITFLEQKYCEEGHINVGALNITGPLLDGIDDMYEISDKFNVINITSMINDAIYNKVCLQSSLSVQMANTDITGELNATLNSGPFR
jgi:hypothetical protein